MKKISNIYAIFSLIIANCIPLVGVLYYDWNVFSLMLLYWLENVVIGVFTVLKMQKAEGGILNDLPMVTKINGKEVNSFAPGSQRLFLIPFFSLHFGLFTLVHGIFVLAFFFSRQVSLMGLVVGFLSLCFSHYMSYRLNFIDRGEYKTTSVGYLFISPYPRIFVMQLTVILGGIFAMSNQSMYAGVLLVVFKTIADLVSHLMEHRRLAVSRVKDSVGVSYSHSSRNHKIGELTYQSDNFEDQS